VQEYIYKRLPINLLCLKDMALLTRAQIVESVTDEIVYGLQNQDSHFDAIFTREADGQIRLTPLQVKKEVSRMTKYAILSHKWDRDEITHDNLAYLESLTHTAGYDKLHNFLSKASDYGCKYAWFDTGCINKASSAEHEESIRSMFEWYSHAFICIVHLAETEGRLDASLEGKDNWFTRGWTLQELLAPRRMKFYGKDWTPLLPRRFDIDRTPKGDWNEITYSQFWSDVSAASGIELFHLAQFQPGVRFAREVLYWSSVRQTTRDEDIAYCLISLLDLRLAVAYGEGKLSAVYRLQVEIMQRTEDRGLFLWSGRPSPWSSMFAANSSGFYPAHWSDDGVSSDCLFQTPGVHADPSLLLTNCGLRISMSVYDIKSVPSRGNTYWSSFGFIRPLQLLTHGIGKVNVQVVMEKGEDDNPDDALIQQQWKIGILGSATLRNQKMEIVLPILLRKDLDRSPPRFTRLFTDRFKTLYPAQIKAAEVIFIQ